MDKIWDRKSFEIGSHWLLCCGGDEKNGWPRGTVPYSSLYKTWTI